METAAENLFFVKPQQVFDRLPEIGLNRWEAYTSAKDYVVEQEISEVPQYDQLTMILLWGKFGKLTLKTLFNRETARVWASQLLNIVPEEVTNIQGNDFLNEYSNMFGGHLRGVFEAEQILLGMSLPFCLSGTDELIFSEIHERDNEVLKHRWNVKRGDQQVTCIAELVPTQIDELASIVRILDSIQEAQEEDDGDVEFF